MKTAKWFVNKICHLITIWDLATHTTSPLKEFSFVSTSIILKFAIRESKILNIIICSNLNFFSFDGEFYQSVESSKYRHYYTLGLANYRGNGLTTGCYDSNAECSFKTEILDMTTLKWSDGPIYPFGSK